MIAAEGVHVGFIKRRVWLEDTEFLAPTLGFAYIFFVSLTLLNLSRESFWFRVYRECLDRGGAKLNYY